MLTLTNTRATLRMAGLLLSQRFRRHWMINYPLRSRANSFPGCETPAVLTIEWIYTHSSRAKGDDLWKINTGGKFSNWSVRCHWVDVIFFFFLFWSFFVSDHSRVSATRGVRSRRPERWDEIGSVLCVSSYWPLYPKLLYCLLPSVYSSFFLLFFFLLSWVKWDLQGNKW